MTASTLSGEEELLLLSICMILLNLFSAVQDVAVDSLAVAILDEDELGAGNTVQVVAYKFGSMFSGGLLLYVKEAFGWTPMFTIFASIYFVCILLITQLDLDRLEQKTTRTEQTSNTKQVHLSVSEELKRLFNVPGTLWLTFFVLTYKLCESQAFTIYLVDKKVPTEELALLSTIVRGASILGSFFSGYALTRYKTRPAKLIVISAVIRASAVVGLATVMTLWGFEPIQSTSSTRDWCLKMAGFGLLCLFTIGAGAITTPVFTLMMGLSQKSPKDIQGTHFSMLATSEILGKLMFATVNGWIIDLVGLQVMYVIFSLLAILVPIVMLQAPKSLTQQHQE